MLVRPLFSIVCPQSLLGEEGPWRLWKAGAVSRLAEADGETKEAGGFNEHIHIVLEVRLLVGN